MYEIQLDKGGRYTVTLPSRGSAGYRWSFTIDDPLIVQVERLHSELDPGAPSPGSSRDEQFLLLALAAGSTVVHFAQTRSFGPAKPPLATYEVLVFVSGGS